MLIFDGCNCDWCIRCEDSCIKPISQLKSRIPGGWALKLYSIVWWVVTNWPIWMLVSPLNNGDCLIWLIRFSSHCNLHYWSKFWRKWRTSPQDVLVVAAAAAAVVVVAVVIFSKFMDVEISGWERSFNCLVAVHGCLSRLIAEIINRRIQQDAHLVLRFLQCIHDFIMFRHVMSQHESPKIWLWWWILEGHPSFLLVPGHFRRCRTRNAKRLGAVERGGNFTPEVSHGTWKSAPGKGDSFGEPWFSVSMLNLGLFCLLVQNYRVSCWQLLFFQSCQTLVEPRVG